MFLYLWKSTEVRPLHLGCQHPPVPLCHVLFLLDFILQNAVGGLRFRHLVQEEWPSMAGKEIIETRMPRSHQCSPWGTEDASMIPAASEPPVTKISILHLLTHFKADNVSIKLSLCRKSCILDPIFNKYYLLHICEKPFCQFYLWVGEVVILAYHELWSDICQWWVNCVHRSGTMMGSGVLSTQFNCKCPLKTVTSAHLAQETSLCGTLLSTADWAESKGRKGWSWAGFRILSRSHFAERPSPSLI